MNQMTIAQAVGATSYPGRGILAGKSADGKKAVLAYFIMGRSANSRNRVFVEDGEGIRTQAFDPAAMKDPSLVIYAPVRVLGNKTIFTNGDQTDTVYDYLAEGKTFVEALRTRCFEPDAPNYTPRISAMVTLADGDFSLDMSELKCADGKGETNLRCFWEYDKLQPGTGYFLHTYQGDGNPIPSFEGEPEKVTVECGCAQCTADVIWNALNEDNKVSLWVQTIDLATGEKQTVIVNKNQ